MSAALQSWEGALVLVIKAHTEVPRTPHSYYSAGQRCVMVILLVSCIYY